MPNQEGFQYPSEKMPQDIINQVKSEPQRQMTFGEKLVGLTFNPSNDDAVAKAKKLCADLVDLLEDELKDRENSRLLDTLYKHTLGEILNAQMNAVKVLTLKY